jgi:hypothetical protein
MMAACDDVNSLHQKYLDRGESIYTGMIDSLKVLPGYERVQFKWQINTDPRITKAIIYWNDRTDSVVVDVNRTAIGDMKMEYILPIAGGTYLFEIITADNQGHYSKVVEATVMVYGEDYVQNNLRSRTVEVIAAGRSSYTITWAPADEGVLYTDVSYTDYSIVPAAEKTVRVENSETTTEIIGAMDEEEFTVVSYYQFAGALDVMTSPSRNYVFPIIVHEEIKLPKSTIKQYTPVIDKNDFASILNGSFDENYATMAGAWGSWPVPVFLTIDLGYEAEISRIVMTPRYRPDGRTDWDYGHWNTKKFEVWVTNTITQAPGTYWTGDDWKNDWDLLADVEIIKPEGKTLEELHEICVAGWNIPISGNRPIGRYVRLVVKEIWDQSTQPAGQTAVQWSELTFFGYQ